MNAELKLRRTGITGIALGVVAFLVCKLPLVLVFAGLGGLSGAIAYLPFAQIEIVGLALALIGVALLVFIRVKRSRNQKELHT